ncbi:MAG: hypothetical protein QM734_16340 [Cyclobacteriaceae bacterium]
MKPYQFVSVHKHDFGQKSEVENKNRTEKTERLKNIRAYNDRSSFQTESGFLLHLLNGHNKKIEQIKRPLFHPSWERFFIA